jgi:hypothetical protein
MPKPLINTGTNTTRQINFAQDTSTGTKVNPLLLERRLREKRSSKYVDIMKRLDISGNQMDQSKYQEFLDAVRNEFPDVKFENELLGIVAECHLGKPYEVHSLDLAGNIVVHYKINENMPGVLNRARSLALHGEYVFVEVYIDCLRAVKADGSVTVVK